MRYSVRFPDALSGLARRVRARGSSTAPLHVALSFVLFGLILGATFGGSAAAADLERFAINDTRQVGSNPAAVRIYFEALDGDGRTVAGLQPEYLSASLGEQSATVKSLKRFEDSGEGVAYLFLVDISRSLNATQFESIRQALEIWIADLGDKDRAAIVSFGDSSRLVVDFTNDPRTLLEALGSLGPTDNQTLFHRGLADAITSCQRSDPRLPGRRVIVVLTDGQDEGSGLLVDDILDQLRDEPVPIHAIGYSRLGGGDRQRYLQVLRRLASVSGGTFVEAGAAELAESYGVLRNAIRRVWTADLECPGCITDGSAYRLQVNLKADDRILSQGREVRLLPARTEAEFAELQERSAEVAAAAQDRRDRRRTPLGPEDIEGDEGGLRVPWWLLPLLGLLVAGFLFFSFRRRAKPEPAVASPGAGVAPGESAAASAASASSGTSSSGGKTTSGVSGESLDATVPIGTAAAATGKDGGSTSVLGSMPQMPARRVRFVVVRGSKRGREYTVELRERAVIGSRSTCQCVLADEENIAAEQFEVVQDGRDVVIRNLARNNPTRLNGHPLKEGKKLVSGELVGTRETILRVVVEP